MKNQSAVELEGVPTVVVRKASEQEHPKLVRRGGVLPMQVPLVPRNMTPLKHNTPDLSMLEVMQKKDQKPTASRFAMVVGIADVAARHLLNAAKIKPLQPKPRHSYRAGMRSILRGPSIYDLPSAKRSPSAQSPDEPTQSTQKIKKKPSLYDMIVQNRSSKQKLDMFKIFSKEISKEVENEEEDKPLPEKSSFSYFSARKQGTSPNSRNAKHTPKNRTQYSLSSARERTGASNLSMVKLQPKSRQIVSILQQRANRTSDSFYSQERRIYKKTLEERNASLERVIEQAQRSRNDNNDRDITYHNLLPRQIGKALTPKPSRAGAGSVQSTTPGTISTARDTQLPSIQSTEKTPNSRRNLDLYGNWTNRLKQGKRSTSSDLAAYLSQSVELKIPPPPPLPKQVPKLPFSQYYEDPTGKLKSYFGTKQKSKSKASIPNIPNTYGKKLGAPATSSSGKLAQRGQVLLVDSASRSRDQDSQLRIGSSPAESPHPSEMNTALGKLDIGKLAGSRTQLQAIRVMNGQLVVPANENKDLPFKFQQRTHSSQPKHAMRLSQQKTAGKRAHSKIQQRAAFSISDMVEMQVVARVAQE